MKNFDEVLRENRSLRDRIVRLNEATLRVNASLDLNTVLQEIVDSVRALTGARYGVIATTDEAGAILDFVTSGFTPEQSREVFVWPDGPRLFEHLRSLPGTVRLPDLHAYARSLGLSSEPVPARTMQATPVRHGDVHVGMFFLGDKHDGKEFTGEDEEVLMLFASQAAAAIANARIHRDEQRARADIEALIETSPVGVVVFDARTGVPVSFNQESRRIVEGLRMPDRSVEALLKVITAHREDGRSVSLARLPLAQRSSDAETVHAEEITLSTPDGRSLKTLVNATPIHSADGAVESVVVTLQDLAPLEELERLQAEFLGRVSHELRAPLTSIKGSTATVLGASQPLDPAEAVQFFRIIDEQADHMHGLINDLLDAGRIETGTLSVVPEPTAVASLVDQARNTFLSGGGRQSIRIDLPPDLPWVMADRRRVVQVLNNLLSNASRHSPASSLIRVDAAHDGGSVAISVSDEGQGVPPKQLPHLFRKHAAPDGGQRATERFGLGLSICKGLVEAHGGRIWAESGGTDQGTRFTFTIPAAAEAGSAAPFDPNRAGSPREGRQQARILVVDDDPQSLRHVRDALAEAGYAPLSTGDPRELSRLIGAHHPRLVLLDLMLPGTDGIELMQRVPELADLPVIFISAYGRDETIARALESGAVDYMVKPFSATELVARVQAALRTRTGPEAFRVGDLAIHYEERRVTVAGRPVRLTAIEYELLRVLSVNAGRVLTYDALLRTVWNGRNTNGAGAVRAQVKKLRRKLGDDAASPAYLCTERGVGYRMPRPSDA